MARCRRLGLLPGEGPIVVLASPQDHALAEALIAARGGQALDWSALTTLPELLRGDVKGVIALFGLNGEDPAPSALADHQEAAVARALRLAATLCDSPKAGWARFVLGRATAVRGERPRLESAGVPGLARSFSREQDRWRVTVLDVDPDEGTGRLSETLLNDPGEDDGRVVALRGDQRYVEGLVEVRLPPAETAFEPGAHLLVIGGAGGVGRTLSGAFAGAKLSWIGRRAEDDGVRRALLAARARGQEVGYLTADAGDARALSRAVAEASRARGPVQGVILAGLTLRDARIPELSLDDVRACNAPKGRAALALAEALAGQPVRRLMVAGTALSQLGGAGQAAYAAASALCDANVAWLARTLGCALSIVHWGPWAEVGAVANPEVGGRLERLGFGRLSPEEAVPIFLGALASGAPQLVALRLASTMVSRLGRAPGPPLRLAAGGLPSAAVSALAEITPLPSSPPGQREAAITLPALAAERLREQLGALGWLPELPFAPDELLDLLDPHHRRLGAALLDLLLRAGQLVQSGEGLRALPTRLDLDQREAALIAAAPDLAPQLRLLRHCLDHFEAVLTGQMSGVQVLFPEGSLRLVEGMYRGNPLADLHNALVGRLAAAAARRWSRALPDQVFTVVELGGGTGGTTAAVVEALAGLPVRYRFTDVSGRFLEAAQARFGGGPLPFEVARLDLEQDLAAQGLALGVADVVIAANVVHATRSIRDTLARAASLLKPGGVLLLLEMIRPQDLATLTFGLTPGWWAFEDESRRLPHGPLLSAEGWMKALEEVGFTAGRALSVPPAADLPAEQAVIFAERAPWCAAGAAPASSAAAPTPIAAPATTAGSSWLVGLFSAVTGVPAADLHPEVPFTTYGVDSLVNQELLRRLSAVLGPLPSTLLFEHGTLFELEAALRASHGATFTALGAAAPKPTPAPQPTAPEPAPVTPIGPEPIAVIGVGLRVPGASSLRELWSLFAQGRSPIGPPPPSRASAFTQGAPPGGWRAGFLDDVARFDPLFFRISPRDAEGMDPQERQFLEVCWAAVEDAGLTPEALAALNPVGLFVGVMNHDYEWIGGEAAGQGQLTAASSSPWSIANRASAALDLRGPSMAVDTACSASLCALHLAVGALRRGECAAAVVGGVNLILHAKHLIRLQGAGMLSPRGACRVFAEDADGIAVGEGVAALVLRPLKDALRDGDPIYALVRGTATNASGRTSGYTVPSPERQAEVVRAALADAALPAASVGVIEAHGTGTALGDPIEIAALNRVFSGVNEPVAIGSAKAVLGHLESAAGVVGVVKAILQLGHAAVAPSPGSQPPNPKIPWSGGPLRVQTALGPWPARPGPRRVGVSSFGAGGANAHAVLEEAPARIVSPAEGGEHLVLLSGRTPELLREAAQGLRDHLEGQEQDPAAWRAPLSSIAWTSQRGRAHGRHRLAIKARSLNTLAESLRRFLAGEPLADGLLGEAARGGVGEAPDPADLDAVASAWVTGRPVTFAARPAGLIRAHLPPTPLLREPCWIPEPTRLRAQRPSRPPPAVVIGAGPAGLAVAKALREEGQEVLILEAGPEIGGVWAAPPGSRGGCYRGTRFQTSKHTSFFSDLPPAEEMSLFPDRHEVWAYLNRYAARFDLRSLVRHDAKVSALETEGGLGLRLADGERVEASAIAVCVGQFREPVTPRLPGQDRFGGRVLHSRDYEAPEALAGARVLVVGNGVSGMDLAAELSRVAQVTWSFRERRWIVPRLIGHVPNDASVTPARRLHALSGGGAPMLQAWRAAMPEYMDAPAPA
ncbi:MAG: KR domain-containing protein [Deltaproteobacteria bacterium]|nr:KR domain-containing protein [Deltaproteobacteria bacterium]